MMDGEWISVEDRLPEVKDTTCSSYSDELLVCVGGMAVTVGWFEDYEGGEWHLDPERLWEGEVTHWMPLPEPPSEE